MDNAIVNGVELEYEVTGTGDPLLLISSVLADGFRPLIEEPRLAQDHQLIHYHRRGWVGSGRTPAPVSIADHAEDAVALLDHLGVTRAHVVGHSSGAAIGAQMALDHPDRVHTLTLLELSLMTLPEGQAFLQGAGPVLEAYDQGDHAGAFSAFMGVVSGLGWPECEALFAERVPGLTEQSIRDADTLFGVELPSLVAWDLDADQAARLHRPVLAVLGGDSLALWVEVTDHLRAALPDIRVRTIDGVGHLLHIQRAEPVAQAIGDFVDQHALTPA